MDNQEKISKKQARRIRFLRVAQRRTLKLLKAIRVLAKCSNRSAYEYSENDVLKIFNAVQRELDRARGSFSKDREIDFSLVSEEGEHDMKGSGK